MTAELGIWPEVNTPIAGIASVSWHAHVADALQACKNEATEPEILWLSKRLTRLQAAAESALAQAADETGKTPPSFAESLHALSHG